MKYNNLLNIINDLLTCSEISNNGNYCIMNMYNLNKKEYTIDIKTFNMLYFFAIIKVDSGNLETGETNFVLNLDKYNISKLDKILVLISRINEPIYNFYSTFKIEYLQSLNILKLKEERKNKLTPLKN